MPAIRIFPDPVLRQKSMPVVYFDDALRKTVEILERVMRNQPQGIGIAAPQIGIPRQIALVDVSSRITDAKKLVLINPVILAQEIEKPSREGCMSIPDYTGTIKRYDLVRFRYQDLSGQWTNRESRGIEAICVQHEIDHLKGVLFVDRVTSLMRDMIPRSQR